MAESIQWVKGVGVVRSMDEGTGACLCGAVTVQGLDWVRCHRCPQPPRWVRLMEELDEWQHAHHPNIFPVVWKRLWRPLCNVREAYYERAGV